MADADLTAPAKPTASPEARPSRTSRKLKAWHRRSIVRDVDHSGTLTRVHTESAWSARFAFMIAMSAGIAILGMLLPSPAIVIGAMLISPLMAPIVGLGFALATFDWQEVRKSLIALAGGAILAVLFTGAVVLMSPLQDMTSEILSRTRPNLFDLLVAVFSALAGGYATIKGRGETIVGVALATSLMPPLAAVGYGLATLNMPVAGGAFDAPGAHVVEDLVDVVQAVGVDGRLDQALAGEIQRLLQIGAGADDRAGDADGLEHNVEDRRREVSRRQPDQRHGAMPPRHADGHQRHRLRRLPRQ